MGTELAQQELPEDRVRNFVEEQSHRNPGLLIIDSIGTDDGVIELDLSDLKDVLYELDFARELLAAHERHIYKHHTVAYAAWLLEELNFEAKEVLQ
jgi:hypothetical protein